VGMLFALLVLAPSGVHAARVSTSVSFDSRSVVTTLWYPDNLATIRGVILFTGGQGNGVSGDTRGLVNYPFWQRFAESEGFGLLGEQFTGSYTDAAGGPGQAIFDSLASLAAITAHPELVNAPLLPTGFSNGGYFSFTFAQFAPARVIAFCVNKSGFAKAPMDAAFLAVPGLLIWGSEEPVTFVPTVIHSLVQQGRLQHAVWAEAKEWGVAHQEGTADTIIAPFFSEMIAARYPSTATPRAGYVPLRPLDESQGWLGDISDASLNSNLPSVATFASYAGDKTAAAWLPNAAFATVWRGFVTKTPIDLQAPTASAQFDANQPLQLQAAGFASGETASFLAGATELVASVVPASGTASASWSPRWGGPLGIVALAVDAQHVTTRTSRPAHVVLYGKAAPSAPLATAAVPFGSGWLLSLLGLALAGLGARARYGSK
jgi:hypothetical protein